MKYAIITGASKGLGAAIATRLIQEEFGIFSIARSENQELRNLAEKNHLDYTHFGCDLSDAKNVEHTFNTVMEEVNQKAPKEIWVINNAGIVEPIETVGNLDPKAVSKNIQINLLAPMLITNLFISQIKNIRLTIVNITSGAAERPIHGWSTYCSTKAGLNMFTKTTALEQQAAGNDHLLLGFNPGIMDTDMQGVIRSSSKEAFQDVETFRSYKAEGHLRSTDVVANALIDLLLTEKVESGSIYSISQLV